MKRVHKLAKARPMFRSAVRQMPEGWTYRVRTPDQDLVVRARDGVAHVVLDEFENNYQRED